MSEIKKYEILSGTQSTDDYPYGRLRCHMEWELEFNPKKGYREVRTSTNPKNGRVNKPKRSTYADLIVMYSDEETGYVRFLHFHIHGFEAIAKLINFLRVNPLELSGEESQYLWVKMIAVAKASASYFNRKEGVEGKELLETIRWRAMIQAWKANGNFNDIIHLGFDFDAIEALRETKECA